MFLILLGTLYPGCGSQTHLDFCCSGDRNNMITLSKEPGKSNLPAGGSMTFTDFLEAIR